MNRQEAIYRKRIDVLNAMLAGGPRVGRWMTTGEIHEEMGGKPDWRIYARWMDDLATLGYVERRGKRRQYRLTEKGEAEIAQGREDAIAVLSEAGIDMNRPQRGVMCPDPECMGTWAEGGFGLRCVHPHRHDCPQVIEEPEP